MKILFSIALIFALGLVCFGQNPKPKTTPVPAAPQCNLTLKDAPVLRGLRLEMKANEIGKLFSAESPSAFFPFENFDMVRGTWFSNVIIPNPGDSLTSNYIIPKELYKNVNFLRLSLYLNGLYQIQIGYAPSSVHFETPQQFAKNLSDNFNLPFNAWVYSQSLTPGSNVLLSDYEGKITCAEFEIGITADNNKITLTDLVAEQKIKKREEESRKNFKP